MRLKQVAVLELLQGDDIGYCLCRFDSGQGREKDLVRTFLLCELRLHVVFWDPSWLILGMLCQGLEFLEVAPLE
jgi:hypothetical protein